jgi:hypothetical protein
MSIISALPPDLRAIIPAVKQDYSVLFVVDITELCINPIAPGYALIRPLTRREFNGFAPAYEDDPTTVEDDVISSCLVYPDMIAHSKHYLAGFDQFVSQAVFLCSGFAGEQTLIRGVLEGRDYAKSLEAAITTWICKAFPRYIPSDVEDMIFEDQMKLACMAENILSTPIPYEDFLDPGAKKQKEEDPVKRMKRDRIERFNDRQKAAAAPPPPAGSVSFGEGAEGYVTSDKFQDGLDGLEAFIGRPQ